jgi:Protein of unknown function (DUF3568)
MFTRRSKSVAAAADKDPRGPTMNRLRTALILGAVVLAVLPLSGCLIAAAAGAAGAGVAYCKGDTEDTIQGTPYEVAAAAEATFVEMGMAVTRNTSSAVDAEVVGRTGQDRKVEVTARSTSSGASAVSVRAGTWGDDSLQARIFDRIRINVAAAREQAPPATSGN